jgi:hypothetical protein
MKSHCPGVTTYVATEKCYSPLEIDFRFDAKSAAEFLGIASLVTRRRTQMIAGYPVGKVGSGAKHLKFFYTMSQLQYIKQAYKRLDAKGISEGNEYYHSHIKNDGDGGFIARGIFKKDGSPAVYKSRKAAVLSMKRKEIVAREGQSVLCNLNGDVSLRELVHPQMEDQGYVWVMGAGEHVIASVRFLDITDETPPEDVKGQIAFYEKAGLSLRQMSSIIGKSAQRLHQIKNGK